MTFYKEEDACTGIGVSFAMLCGMEGKKEYIAFGCDVYKNAGKIIDDIIETTNFEKID